MDDVVCFGIGQRVYDIIPRWYYSHRPECMTGTIVGYGSDPRRPFRVCWDDGYRGTTCMAPDSLAIHPGVGLVKVTLPVTHHYVCEIEDHGRTFRVGDRVVKFDQTRPRVGRIKKIRDDWPSWCGSNIRHEGGWKRVTKDIRYWVEWEDRSANSWTGGYHLYVIQEGISHDEAFKLKRRLTMLPGCPGSIPGGMADCDPISDAVEAIKLAYENPKPQRTFVSSVLKGAFVVGSVPWYDPLERMIQLESTDSEPEVIDALYPDDV